MELKYIAKCKHIDKRKFEKIIEADTLISAVKKARKASLRLGQDHVWRIFADIEGEQYLLLSGGHKNGSFFHQEWGNRERLDEGKWLPKTYDNIEKLRQELERKSKIEDSSYSIGSSNHPPYYLLALSKSLAEYLCTKPIDFAKYKNHISFWTSGLPELIGIAEYERQPDGSWTYKWNDKDATIEIPY